MKQAFVNGNYVAAADAKISIFDRGLLFGDSIYEVLPVYKGQALFLDRHLNRLFSNLQKIKINKPDCDWPAIITRLVEEHGGGNCQVYIQVTRGNQGVRKHDTSPDLIPTVIAFVLDTPFSTHKEKNQGLRAKLIDDIRWERCDIKTTSLLGNIMLNEEAVTSGYDTTILTRGGFITEGSTSNVFIVTKDGAIKTPPLNQFCLPGITRSLAIELMHELQWLITEENITIQDLFDAQEVWITSTTKEIFPVLSVNDSIIGTGKAGEYWSTIDTCFQNLISSFHE